MVNSSQSLRPELFQQPSDYLHPTFQPFIDPHQIKTIFEVGSRDGIDAIKLRDIFSAEVYAFECNPEAVLLCRSHLTGQSQIHLIEKAAWHTAGSIPFYPVVETIRDGVLEVPNIGASSCFRARDDYLEQNKQNEVLVEAIRLDHFCQEHNINQIDLLCLDVQGAALEVLEGLGEMLGQIKYIIAELERRPLYNGQALYPEVDQLLQTYGFEVAAEIYRDDWFSDYLYVLKHPPTQELSSINHTISPTYFINKPSQSIIKQYQNLMDETIQQFDAYPSERFSSRGIVICGGGDAYFPCIWVCINMLRKLGCDLPIELWYLGEAEMSQEMIDLVTPFNVTCRDAHQVAKQYSVHRLDGWELKPYAIINSAFKELLYIDADNFPVQNPEFLFDEPAYLETGVIFWPDRYRTITDTPWLKQEAWDICQVPYRDEPEFEAGQIIINKEKCWRPLQLTMHINEHSNFYYEYFYGDKDTFHLAWHRLQQPFSLVPHPVKSLQYNLAMIQFDFAGNELFQHRSGDKWNLAGENQHLPGFQFETECLQLVQLLKSRWSGQVRNVPDEFTAQERKAYERLISNKMYQLTIPGYINHPVQLTHSFEIRSLQYVPMGHWTIHEDKDGQARLTISLIDAFRSTPLYQNPEEVWQGKGIHYAWPSITFRPLFETASELEMSYYHSLQKQVIDQTNSYPAHRFTGRGIVIAAGGAYFPLAWVCINVLRKLLNCQLPIQVWYLGSHEMSQHLIDLLEDLQVECIDASQIREKYPVRILNGWEVKCYAMIHSPFREVIYLDADNVPLVDPETLFDTPAYLETGALFWPDFGRLSPQRAIWRICQLPYRDEPEFEAGQMVIDKARSWSALRLAMHFNEHSDFYYKYINGDKETFHLAWRLLDQNHGMCPYPLKPLEDTMCQHDYEKKQVIFQHRNFDKWRLDGTNKRIPGFQFEVECLNFLEELKDKLS